MQILHEREVKKIATRQNRGEDSQFPILLNLFPLRRKERLQEFFWLHGSRRVVYAWKDSFPFEKRPIYRGKRNNELNTRACSSFWDYFFFFFSFLNTLVCPPSFPPFFLQAIFDRIARFSFIYRFTIYSSSLFSLTRAAIGSRHTCGLLVSPPPLFSFFNFLFFIYVEFLPSSFFLVEDRQSRVQIVRDLWLDCVIGNWKRNLGGRHIRWLV